MLDKLRKLTINNELNLSYINLDNDSCYKGWVCDFRLTYKPTNQQLGLDLTSENDLFLLFVLASSWSKTGPWENALFFTSYLKINYDISKVLNKEIKIIPNEYEFIEDDYIGIKARKTVSFRKDFYDSVEVLIENWDDIKRVLLISEKVSNWKVFIEYISHLNGLGTGNKNMKIKIPFVLRELRCQKIFSNIDGKYCCVADERVRVAYKSMNRKLPLDYLEASSKIYKDFGDLYDIPPFAHKDFEEKGLI